MTPPQVFEIDGAHYDMIVSTAAIVERIEADMEEIKALVKGCPCKSVQDLEKKVGTLEEKIEAIGRSLAYLKGKLVAIGMVAGTVAGWIGSLLHGVIGGRP